MRISRVKKRFNYCITLRVVLALFACICVSSVSGQGCPYNIDFETGSFDRWTCWLGPVSSSGTKNVMALSPSATPIDGTHVMHTANTGEGLDPFGYFPVNCPNGSGHSIQLGNTGDPKYAQGASYDFTIPANQNEFTLTYNYAFVLHSSSSHKDYQQSRFEVQIMDVSDSLYVPCGFFSFNAGDSSLPGFEKSTNYLDTDVFPPSPIWYKSWTSVSVNLSGRAGRKFRIFFKVAGCTSGDHFGYAYVDVNSECTNAVLGSTFCPKDTAVIVNAPYGISNYTWYDSTLTQRLGRGPTLTIKPPPPSGTKIAVTTEPDLHYGCPQTTYIRLMDTLRVVANAGRDTSLCKFAVRIGDAPRYGFTYKWSPAAGLSDANVANPLASPTVTTNYVLTVTPLNGGQCIARDTVQVALGVIDNSLQLIGGAALCSGGTVILKVPLTDSIQWVRDDKLLPAANQPDFLVKASGVYYAILSNKQGCSTITRRLGIYAIPTLPPDASFTLKDTATQCLAGNKFSFINTSNNTINVQYKWMMGDGTEFTTKDVSYTYKKPGTYDVNLISDNTSCTSTSRLTVQVRPGTVADFKVDTVCINIPATVINTTVDTFQSPINYLWKLGNGQASNLRNPPPQVFSVAGSYPVSLSVSNMQCPLPSTVVHNIVVEKPLPPVTYPMQYAAPNIPLTLHARLIGNSFMWKPATSLTYPTTSTPVFNAATNQSYEVEIKTATGCITIDTQLVTIVKNIDIYVPTAFSPNNDGKNDVLQPITNGWMQVRSFQVYNRWGEILFETKENGKGWDGTYKGVQQPMQTIVWILEAAGADGIIFKRSGTTTLIR